MKGAGSIEIQGFLIQGTHDALIELRNGHGTRHGNHLALHAAEVLLQKYPMLLSDLQHSESPDSRRGGDRNDLLIKIKFQRETYPLLASCHGSLAWGGRGVGMINLLNRLYMIAEASPEEVEALMQKRREEQMLSKHPRPSNELGSTAAGHVVVATSADRRSDSSTEAGKQSLGPEITEIVLQDVYGSQDLPDELSVLTAQDDPLNDLVFGNTF